MKRGKRYQPKGLLHAPRFTTRAANCGVCRKALPTPRPNSKRTCDQCKSDLRRERNKQWRDRQSAKRADVASQRKPVIRECQHKQEQVGPICGVKFEAKPRIGKNGVNHGVSPEQIYCTEHQKPKAVARRRWLNRNVENYKRLQNAYRHRNLKMVREKQRIAAKKKREKIAAILAGAAVAPGAQPKPAERGRGRKPEKATEAKIVLAARLELEGLGQYAITDQLFPPGLTNLKTGKLLNKHQRFHRLEAFLKKYRERIDREKKRDLGAAA